MSECGLLTRFTLRLALFCALWNNPAFAAQSWSFLVYGDSRSPVPWGTINEQILNDLAVETVRLNPDFVVFPGDLAYYGSEEAFLHWREVMQPVYDAGIAVYTVVGNHELDAMDAWTNVFGGDLPDTGPAGQVDRTYFVRHKNALVVALDEFAGPGFFDPSWLHEVLATNVAPHIFSAGHMPAFKAVHYDCLDDDTLQRDDLCGSLAAAGCRTYFCGHDHFYDHLRVQTETLTANEDLHQYIVGTAGAPLYGDGVYDGDNGAWMLARQYHENNYGYVLVEVADLAVTLTWHRWLPDGTFEATDDSWSYVAQHRPVLRLDSLTPSGAVMGFTAREGFEYVIEKSDDLQAWTAVLTNSSPGSVQFPVNLAGSGCRMFRVRQR